MKLLNIFRRGNRAKTAQTENRADDIPQKPIEGKREAVIGGAPYVLEPFTEGGICVVMKGMPQKPGFPSLSVKMVREQWLNHPAVRRQFSNESQIVKELRSPRLPKYVGRGLLDNQAYYAYEFIEGFPLINISQQANRFPPELVREIASDIVKQLLEQLSYLHDRFLPVIHGDISSENILIDNRQQIYLVDFGCSHFQKQANKDSFQWIAKPSFISPEQARGDSWDHRSDLYQAGILFYELIMNQRWNVGDTKRDKILFAASNQRPRDNFLAHMTSANISRIVARMLDPNPEYRYQTAKEIIDDLARIISF